jgi:hypothetical protein
VTAALASVGADANVFAVPTATQSCQLLPYPANCCPILPTAALSCQLLPYPANCCPILPTAALSCQLLPYPANCRPILPTAALSCQLTSYPAIRRLPCAYTPCACTFRSPLRIPPPPPPPVKLSLRGLFPKTLDLNP